jgi:hypothetical protein
LVDIQVSGGGAGQGLNVQLTGANSNPGTTSYAQKILNTRTGTTSTNIGLYATASGANTNYAAIFENGNVGIGDIAPLTKLQILHTGSSPSNAIGTATVQLISSTAAGTDVGSAIAFGGENGNDSPGNLNNFAAIKGASEAGSIEGYLSFFTYNGSSFAEKARINSAGELQIGSTSDLGAYKLQVTGDSILDGGLIVNEGGANKDFRVESDTITSAIAVAGSTGNVTIGTLDTDLTAPTTSGTTRCVITDANGQLSFTTCGGGGGAWSDITNPTGDLSLTFDAGEETLFTTNATTATAFSIASSTLSSGTLLDLTVTGTSALDNQKGLNISLSGVNGTASQTTYGAYASNAHTGTSATNFGGYFSATGASNSYNIGLYSEASGATGNNSYSGYFVGDNFVVGDSFLGNNYLNIEIVSGLFGIGDIDGVSNGTHLSIDDTAEEFNFSQNGNVTIGGASSTYKLNVLSSLTGQTVNKRVADFSNTGSTFDTTSGNLTSYGGYFSSTSTESAGGNVLTNVALYATASGADANYAAIFENGNVGIGDTTPSALFTVGSGDLFQVNSTGAIAAATGITSSGTITFSGLGGAGTKCLQTDNSGVVTAAASACGSGGGLTVGTTAITSGGTNRVLYENGSNILSESADFTYDGTTLGVATSSTTASNKALNTVDVT